MRMQKFFYPTHPVRCITTASSDCGKSVLLTKLILIIFREYNKKYICSPSLRQPLYQKLNKCFSNHLIIHIIPNIINEEDIDIVIDGIFEKKDFKSQIVK